MPAYKTYIEESGTGRRWRTVEAAAHSLGITTGNIRAIIKNNILVDGKAYYHVPRDDSICWNCKNTANHICPLFTNGIAKPPDGAKYQRIKLMSNYMKPEKGHYYGYKVKKCPGYNPEVIHKIIK